jgi:hypothetical protein
VPSRPEPCEYGGGYRRCGQNALDHDDHDDRDEPRDHDDLEASRSQHLLGISLINYRVANVQRLSLAANRKRRRTMTSL